MTGDGKQKRLVFVGGGHVHLLSLKHLNRFARHGAEVVLIGPDRFHYYSGMGPGMVSRFYEPAQIRFDVQAMVESQGGRFVKGKVASIDSLEKRLILHGGEEISYDTVSFNVGSYVPMDRIPGAKEAAIPVKPIENLELARDRISRQLRKGAAKILVVGAGPAGVELAGNIERFVHSQNGRAEIILAASGDRVLPGFPSKASVLAEGSLSQRGVQVLHGFRVTHMEQGVARSESGGEVSFDVAILTIGIVPQEIFERSGLETADDGGLLVDEQLQSTSCPDVFGGGDCISIKGHRVDRVGVYAVREAPVLFHNLLAKWKGELLKDFRPQRGYLLIFNLGDGSGLFVKGSWVWKGRLAFVLKNYLDKSFMSKFQV